MKFYVENFEGQFIVEADDEQDAVIRFVRRCIHRNETDRALRMTYWVHQGAAEAKQTIAFTEIADRFTLGEWRFLCFAWHERRGQRFMRSLQALVNRPIRFEEF